MKKFINIFGKIEDMADCYFMRFKFKADVVFVSQEMFDEMSLILGRKKGDCRNISVGDVQVVIHKGKPHLIFIGRVDDGFWEVEK